MIGFLIFVLGILFLIFDFKKDKRATRDMMADVKQAYQNFSVNVDSFNDIRNELYLNKLNNIYYDTLDQIDPDIKESFHTYEETVNQVKASVKTLSKFCDGVYYPDSKINSQCRGYKNVYEQIINAFVSDVKLYNKSIKSYNKYQSGLGKEISLSTYDTSLNYIDYDGDGNFDGKDD